MRKRVVALALAAAATLMLIPGAGHAKATCFEKTFGRLHVQVGYCP